MTTTTNTNVPVCISCGMPMRTPEEHSLGDVAKPFCKYCGGADGTLKSYDQVLMGMIAFIKRTQGLDGAIASEMAKGMMAKLPAWSGR